MNVKKIKKNDYNISINEDFYCDELLSIITNINDEIKTFELVYKVRNAISKKKVLLNDKNITLGVKSFPRFNRLKSFFYKDENSKAYKNFYNSKHLIEHQVNVPIPVAVSEKWKDGILLESYYFYVFIENMSDFKIEMVSVLENEKDCTLFLNLLKPVAQAFKNMHDSGFLHKDSGYQNIMLKREKDKFKDITFIDLNRGRIFNNLTLKQRASDLAKLEIPSDMRRIFFYMYFHPDIVPEEFLKYEAKYRKKITFHNESRKYRHPIRHLKSKKKIDPFVHRPEYKDMWLWDKKSGQPAVILDKKDRKKCRSKIDLLNILWSNIKYGFSIYRDYKKNIKKVFTKEIAIFDKCGVNIEIDEKIQQRLNYLYKLPKISVFLRVYHHKGKDHWDKTCEIIKELFDKDYEVSIGLVQDRECVKKTEKFKKFASYILQRNFAYIKYCEIGHAINRVKWGIYTFKEYRNLIFSLKDVLKKYNEINYLFPAVNDFEYYFSVYCLDILKKDFNISGNSCHLYVDRRGAPENFQGKFSLLEKCVLGKSVGFSILKKDIPFFITEINWPLKNKGVYSPIGCPYVAPGIIENPIHIDEITYSSYMIRSYLIALCSGSVERIWWWRLCSNGFGLIDDINNFNTYKSFDSFKFFLCTIKDRKFVRLESKKAFDKYYFDNFVILCIKKDVDKIELKKYLFIKDIVGNTIKKIKDYKINSVYYFFEDKKND